MRMNTVLKITAVTLAVIGFVLAAFYFLKSWEEEYGKYPEVIDDFESAFTYDGKDYVLKDNIETFLILGLDKYEGAETADSHESGVQADFLLLFVFDNESKECTAIHINRDTMTSINKLGIGGVKTDTFTKQIALSYNYVADDNDKVRCGNTANAVSNLLMGMPVKYYASLTMDSVAAINDLVGGVEVTVLDDFTGIDDTLVKGETVTLKGEQALCYVRTRYGLEDSSNSTRMERQQQYMEVLYSKLLSCIAEDEEFIVESSLKMSEYMVSNRSITQLQELIKKFSEYKFNGIQEIEGSSELRENFIEFYPEEDSLKEMVVECFFEQKK